MHSTSPSVHDAVETERAETEADSVGLVDAESVEGTGADATKTTLAAMQAMMVEKCIVEGGINEWWCEERMY